MERNLLVYEMTENMEDFIFKLKNEQSIDNLEKENVCGFESWSNDEFVIVDNLKDNQLGDELISLIQESKKDFCVCVRSIKIFELRPEFHELKDTILYSTRLGNRIEKFY